VRTAIGLAVRPLPTRADRNRYLDEFLADLYGQSAGAQWRYAVGVLSQAVALRAALCADLRHLAEPLTAWGRWRYARCHILRIHYWKTFSTDDGSRYTACAVCRREHPGGPGGGPEVMAALSTGFGHGGTGGFG
jgi:hypothetical protein